MDSLERELKELIVEVVMLEDVSPADIDSDALLFPTLDLDSIDGLELAVAIKRRYGVEFVDGDENNNTIFRTVRNLANHVRAHRDKPPHSARSEQIFQVVADTICDLFEFSPDDIHLETRLVEDLDLDSIDALDMVVKLQDYTGKRITEEALKKVRTIGQIVTLVEELLDEPGVVAIE